jgi:alpha-L-rhamnosidase
MAQALGRTADAQKYSRQFQEIRQAFIKNYVSPDGVIGPPVSVDVTGIVRGLVKDGKLAFTLSNEVMKGDPAPNHLKSLHLLYSLGGKEREQVIAEGQPVDVQGSTAEPVQIMKATYGSKDADSGDVQGSYALALQFGLLDEPLQSRSVRRLAEMVAKNGYHPTTGFWSSVELLLALSSHGQHSIAARMVDQRTRPSWGYMVESGGTTLWEAFDANTRNLSLNHWTHSAVNEWLWRNVAGLNPDEGHPGYEEFNIRPRPTEEVSWCKATYRSIRGDIAMDWSVDGHTFTLKLVVPPGSVATVFIPANKVSGVMEGSKPASQAEGVSFVRMELGNAVFTVQSGVYRFTSGELPAM